MVIDFHTHAFADKIAEKAMGRLSLFADCTVPVTDGTLSDLLDKMDESGIDRAVVLSIATKPSQHKIVNRWAAEIQNSRFYSFGSVHPDGDDALETLEHIKELGLYGVKLHPDYQDFFADEERIFPIYQKCSELGLPVSFHAGFDPISPDTIHATPAMFAKVLKEFPKLTAILAHMGSMRLWDEVEKELAGKTGVNVYFDTSAVSEEIHPEQFKRIVRAHGPDRILFATDMPWDCPKRLLKLVKSCGFSAEDEEKILYKNALELLNIGTD
ncbi:MAG: amidohydrolase family protein [Oscillospiraceae bacterium]|jgi:predicted TIM-barrel fold metal-dependent hydrolase|nr:amidohydrolase family protein [Oscillospiraceae bacterium]